MKLSRRSDGEVFRGGVVGLGALGVIARITLDIQPTYTVRQWVYENLPLDEMKEHFDEIQSSACPHWGKLFTMSPVDVRSRYEKLDDFRQLATKYDPNGKFRNDILNTTLFSR